MTDLPRILISRRLPEKVEALADQHFRVRYHHSDTPLTPEQLIGKAANMEGLLVTLGDQLDAGVINKLPETVRIIATFSVGTDHIDVAAARRRDILVTNTPGVLVDATADLTWFLILAATRRAREGLALLVEEEPWTGWAPTQLMGRDLKDKRLGVVGLGQIGAAVARRARAFGMEVHYTGRRRKPAGIENGAVFHPDLESLLAVSHVLSLHCPLTPQTRQILNDRTLALLPEGAFVINTARGELIDDNALIAALESGHVAGAGLDVFAGEPALDERYLDFDNVFPLPHLGSATLETRQQMGVTALKNLKAYFDGRQPPNRVMP